MEYRMFSIEFLITSLLVILVPGTGVIYTVSTGLARGWQIAVVAALGCTLGIVPHLLACIFGLSAILHMGSSVFRFLKLAGVAYLLYLAWMMWRDTGSLSLNGEVSDRSNSRIILRAVLINALNPKLTLFFFAFLPQFLTSGKQTPVREMISLGLIFMAMTALIFIVYGILASVVRSFIAEKPKAIGVIQKSFAGLLAVLAVRLALTTEE